LIHARVLEESLRFAGVLDSSRNILPVRDGGSPPGGGTDAGREEPGGEDTPDDRGNGGGDASTLRVEVPVGEDRKVVVHYPRDLAADEAKKVGNVLAAIVS
jgi:hypothetical protein